MSNTFLPPVERQSKTSPEGNNSTRQRAVFEMLVEILQRRGVVTFSTYGTSMQPLIPPGSLVQVQGCSIEQVRVGDVVLLDSGYAGPKRLIHRVMKIRRTPDGIQLYTKGDSSPRDRQFFTERDCLGKALTINTSGREFSLNAPIWRPINVLVAYLSSFQALFTDGVLWFRKRDFTHQILPQRLALSCIKRLVLVGKRFSRRKSEPLLTETLHA
jgi:signal peptidase I